MAKIERDEALQRLDLLLQLLKDPKWRHRDLSQDMANWYAEALAGALKELRQTALKVEQGTLF